VSEKIAGLGEKPKSSFNFVSKCSPSVNDELREELVYFEPKVDKFKLEKFAPLSMEIILMLFLKNSLTLCITERNGNAKIILTDLSIKLTRLIHKK
jgi:DNA polymerase-3 subunit delta'